MFRFSFFSVLPKICPDIGAHFRDLPNSAGRSGRLCPPAGRSGFPEPPANPQASAQTIVGADASVRPAERTDFTEISGEFAASQTGRQSRRPLQLLSSLPPLLRGGGSAEPRRRGAAGGTGLHRVFGFCSCVLPTSQSASLTAPLKRGAKGGPAPRAAVR